jgi:hypothetical protein
MLCIEIFINSNFEVVGRGMKIWDLATKIQEYLKSKYAYTDEDLESNDGIQFKEKIKTYVVRCVGYDFVGLIFTRLGEVYLHMKQFGKEGEFLNNLKDKSKKVIIYLEFIKNNIKCLCNNGNIVNYDLKESCLRLDKNVLDEKDLNDEDPVYNEFEKLTLVRASINESELEKFAGVKGSNNDSFRGVTFNFITKPIYNNRKKQYDTCITEFRDKLLEKGINFADE